MISWILKLITRGHSENHSPGIDWEAFLAMCKEHPATKELDPGTADFWRAVQSDEDLHKAFREVALYYEG